MRFKIPESVLVVVHTPRGEVLLMERADIPGFWQSVTGSKDRWDEDWRETAIRELREETGLIVGAGGVTLADWQLQNVYEIYPGWRSRYGPGVTHNTERVFGCRVPSVCEITLAPREHVRCAWMVYTEAADCCFSPSNAEAILWLPRLLSA